MRMRRIEAQYPNPFPPKPAAPANPQAAVTSTGRLVVPSASPQKKPPEAAPQPNPEKVRAAIRDHVRQEFFPGLPERFTRDKKVE